MLEELGHRVIAVGSGGAAVDVLVTGLAEPDGLSGANVADLVLRKPFKPSDLAMKLARTPGGAFDTPRRPELEQLSPWSPQRVMNPKGTIGSPLFLHKRTIERMSCCRRSVTLKIGFRGKRVQTSVGSV